LPILQSFFKETINSKIKIHSHVVSNMNVDK